MHRSRMIALRIVAAAILLAGEIAPAGAVWPVPASSIKLTEVVATDRGPVRGVVHEGVREFKGIPYAAAPVGDLRWALPQAPAAWTQALDATEFRSGCPQVARYGLTEAGYDEDCLFINVTSPIGVSPARKRTVIVWIYGGAFVGGSSALYPLGAMAKAGDAVIVSFNYRLGVFGFMSHPAFEPDHNGGCSSNSSGDPCRNVWN
jgi:para-nitrobenzyl esterase